MPRSTNALDLKDQLSSIQTQLASTQDDLGVLQIKFQALTEAHREVNDAKKAIDEMSQKQSQTITIHEGKYSELLERFTTQGRELDEVSQSLKKAQEDASSKDENSKKQSQAFTLHEKKYSELHEKFTTQGRELAKISQSLQKAREDASSKDENSKKQSQAFTLNEKDYSELLERFTIRGLELDEISKSLKKAQEDASSKEEHITEQNQALSKLDGDLEILRANRTKLEDRIKTQQVEVSKKTSEIDSKEKQVRGLKNENSKLTENLSQAQKPCEVHKKEIFDLAEELAVATKEKTDVEEQLEDLIGSFDELQCVVQPSRDDQERLKKSLEELAAEHGLLLSEAHKLVDGLLLDPGADHSIAAANLKRTFFSLREESTEASSQPSAPNHNVIMDKFLGQNVGHDAGVDVGNSVGNEVGGDAGNNAKVGDASSSMSLRTSSSISRKIFGRPAAPYMRAFGKGNKRGRRRRIVPLGPTLRDQLRSVAPSMVSSPVDGSVRADDDWQNEPIEDSASQRELEDWQTAHEGNATIDTVESGAQTEPANNHYVDSATQTAHKINVNTSTGPQQGSGSMLDAHEGNATIDTVESEAQAEPAKNHYVDSATQTAHKINVNASTGPQQGSGSMLDAHEGNATIDPVESGAQTEPAKNPYADSATQTESTPQHADADAPTQGKGATDTTETGTQTGPAKHPYADSATQTDSVAQAETGTQTEPAKDRYADSATQTDPVPQHIDVKSPAQANGTSDTAEATTQTQPTRRPYADSATQTESLAPKINVNASTGPRKGGPSMFLLLILLAILVATLFTFWYCRHLSQIRLEDVLSHGGEKTRRVLASLRAGGGSGTAVPSWLWDDGLIEVTSGKACPNLCKVS